MIGETSDQRWIACLEAAKKGQWNANGKLFLNDQDYENGKPVQTEAPFREFAKLNRGMIVVEGHWQAGGRIGVVPETIFHRAEFSPSSNEEDIHTDLRLVMAQRMAVWLYNSDFQR